MNERTKLNMTPQIKTDVPVSIVGCSVGCGKVSVLDHFREVTHECAAKYAEGER